ncbi:Uncharacterized membrane-anchored protein YitT, contains DUF161 and DUF2179 domains [Pseudarcicella hirudinis]|uniref:Uncharacterized membrane-anchored protein YitT, contains DUF161 and DUF2179 domains n=1 Tax=Pseudarcicella hirudinis TaxID=1079859 RepID=A0A1I5MES1_9BACT|nr:YitT family protein [Pseudarcicella hirudinis]SFP07466.1 Uncharacterized membrane-anchored protein YitT, contains DUF161 and DUF2179 domains [Pseudarcicella hirudinis]
MKTPKLKIFEEPARVQRLVFRQYIKDAILICAGIALATLGLKGFLLPNGFLDGGVTGISLLTSRLTGIDLSILILCINIPFIYIGSKQISKTFAIRTFLAVAGLALVVHFFEMQHLTNDKLLISVFGGFFLGAGIGLAMRGGCVIDGTEVLAVFVSRNSSLSVGDFIAVFNVLLFAASAFLINLETALYSMLSYLSASKTVDFLITGIEEYIGVTVISERAEEIKEVLVKKLAIAVTVYKGEGGFGKNGLVENDRKIIFSVVTRLEVQKLKIEIEKIDPKAFVIQHTINDTKGGMIKKRPLH